jgi:hypothetical protein
MKKIAIIVIIFLLCVQGLYWVKCRSEFDFVPGFSLSAVPPFSFLQKRNPHNIVYAAEDDLTLLADDFESDESAKQWSDLWMRVKGDVSSSYERSPENDTRALVIDNQGARDWSIRHGRVVAVRYGDLFSFEADVMRTHEAMPTLSVILYEQGEPKPEIKQWHFARQSVPDKDQWARVKKSFMVPDGVSHIQFRLTGSGAGRVFFDNVVFRKTGTMELPADIPAECVLENGSVRYRLDIHDKLITVIDKRTDVMWQDSRSLVAWHVTGITRHDPDSVTLRLIHAESLETYDSVITLSPDMPELIYEIKGDSETALSRLDFPFSFEITAGMSLCIPRSQGYVYDFHAARNEVPGTMRYKGGFPMPFIGVTSEDGSGWMQIVETPFDAELVKDTSDNGLRFRNRWRGEKNVFGYDRRIRQVFLDAGGYVAMAKRYREYARKEGFVKSLREKDDLRRGNIEKLIGAANIWFWGKGKKDFARELEQSGIKKVLFSTADWSVEAINELGYLTSIYDIYQDIWPPIYRDITKRVFGWPDDLVLNEDGDWIKGWTIKKEGREYPGGVICSIRGLERAKESIPKDVKKRPFTARFIDTTTSTPWRECFSPVHPTTRREDFHFKMQLLDFVSGELGLVTGTEDGFAGAVPYVDYFEGMMSPGFARLPGSGRGVARVEYMEPTEKFLKYQVGEKYRIPLWELVFHDCVVSTWYWGDSVNRIPEVWWRRDLFNILYGNMPLWAIRDWAHWREHKDRFIESYNTVAPVFEKVGFAEMLSHRFLSDDHAVQETLFSNDVRILVNFGADEFKLQNSDQIVPARGFVVFDNGKVWKRGVCR